MCSYYVRMCAGWGRSSSRNKGVFGGSRGDRKRRGYSSYDSAYENNDKIYIREYYLQIDLKNNDRCINYFSEDYCKDYSKKDKPTLSDKTIKNDGVLYEHVFIKQDQTFYLESSNIVSER